MFEVTLGNGQKFSVTYVNEGYVPANNITIAKYTLSMDINFTDKTIQDFVNLFDETALSSPIIVTLNGEECATYTGYNIFSSISIRLNDDGGKNASIFLEKAA